MGMLSMSRAEREAFLAETHLGVVTVSDEGGRAPLSLPVWYRYEPGGVIHFVTGGSSKKMKLLRKSGRATLVAQTESSPYRYVTIEGPVDFETDFDAAREVEQFALRYLGAEVGRRFLALTKDMFAGRENVLVSIRPERWASADYAKLLGPS